MKYYSSDMTDPAACISLESRLILRKSLVGKMTCQDLAFNIDEH